MTPTPLIIINMMWAFGGLICGYIGGVFVQYEQAEPRGRMTRRELFRALFGIFALLVIGTGGFVNFRLTSHLADEVVCQRDFNTNYRAIIQDNIQAQRKFLNAFIAPDHELSPIERQQAINDYLATLRDVPVPNNCGY